MPQAVLRQSPNDVVRRSPYSCRACGTVRRAPAQRAGDPDPQSRPAASSDVQALMRCSDRPLPVRVPAIALHAATDDASRLVRAPTSWGRVAPQRPAVIQPTCFPSLSPLPSRGVSSLAACGDTRQPLPNDECERPDPEPHAPAHVPRLACIPLPPAPTTMGASIEEGAGPSFRLHTTRLSPRRMR
jgi:hypothetical protein